MAEDQTTSSGDPTDFLKIAQAAFSESTTFFDAGIRKEIEGNLRHFNSEHTADSKYHHEMYRTRSKVFRPKTRAAIRKNEAAGAAAFFSNKDAVTIEPENQDDPQNVAGAEFFNELLNIRLRRSVPWFLTVQGAYQDTQAVGVCASYQYWDWRKGGKIDKPCIDLIPIENMRFSPAADWRDVVGTSPYLIQMIPMYVKDVRARGKRSPNGQEPKWNLPSDTELLSAARSNSDSIRMVRERGRQDSTTQTSAVNDFTIVWVHRNVVEVDGQDWVYYTLSDQKILSTPKKLEEVYHHGMRPYTIGCCVIETHKVYPSGVARLGHQIQVEINDTANQRRDNVSFAMNKRYFASRTAQVDTRSLVRNVPSSVTLMNDVEKDVKVVETRDVTASAYREQETLNVDFDEISGSFSTGQALAQRGRDEPLGGMEMVSEDANQISGYQLKIFAETWVKPTVYQLIELERRYETDEEILKLAAGNADVQTVDMMLLTSAVSVNVNVGIGATTPQKRLANLIMALKSLKEILQDGVLQQAGLDVEEVAHEVFGKLGYDSGDRFFKWDDSEDPQVSQLKQQIADLESKLAKKEPPELTDAKVKLLEAQVGESNARKVKTNVEAMFGAMQAGEVIAAVPGVAPIADQIIRAGGYQEPNPQGIDPGFAPGEQGPASSTAPAAPAPGLSVEPVTNKRTGIGFTPGAPATGGTEGQATGLPPGMPANTNPLTPKPPAPAASGMHGFGHGIETARPDSGKPNTR